MSDSDSTSKWDPLYGPLIGAMMVDVATEVNEPLQLLQNLAEGFFMAQVAVQSLVAAATLYRAADHNPMAEALEGLVEEMDALMARERGRLGLPPVDEGCEE